MTDESGNYDNEKVKELIREDPSLAQGIFFTQESEQRPQEAYLIAIIDPLTGFNFKKRLEFRFKQCRHGTKMSCVPPALYA